MNNPFQAIENSERKEDEGSNTFEKQLQKFYSVTNLFGDNVSASAQIINSYSSSNQVPTIERSSSPHHNHPLHLTQEFTEKHKSKSPRLDSVSDSEKKELEHFLNYSKNYSPQTTQRTSAHKPFSTNIFKLREQPRQTQRKCYLHENRYILPNPLIVEVNPSNIEEQTLIGEITKGHVSVYLADHTGTEIEPDPSRPLLVTMSDSSTQEMDISNLSASFSIKILQVSDNKEWRLKFDVQLLSLNRVVHTESILSETFIVQSHKMKKKEKPRTIIFDLLPRHGSAGKENEVWIRGSSLRKKGITALFDGVSAKVLDVESNILVVAAPSRKDFLQISEVKVVVANKTKGDMIQAEGVLKFIYHP